MSYKSIYLEEGNDNDNDNVDDNVNDDVGNAGDDDKKSIMIVSLLRHLLFNNHYLV